MLIAAGAYRWLTAEAHVRHFATHWLSGFTGGEVAIDHASFDPVRGIELVGVRIAVPASAAFDPGDVSLAGRTIMRCDAILLRMNLWGLVTRAPVVEEVVGIRPELTLTRRASDGVGNWQMLSFQREEQEEGGWGRLPEVRLRDLVITQGVTGAASGSRVAQRIVQAAAVPVPLRGSTYGISLSKVIGEPHAGGGVEPGRLEVDLENLVVSGNLPSMTIEELAFAAPPTVGRWIQVLEMTGRVRVESFAYGPSAPDRARIRLADASLAFPISEEEDALPAERRYVRVDGLSGRMALTAGGAELELAGRFRSSPMTVSGRLTLGDGEQRSLEDAGFDLEMKVSELPMPRADADQPAEEVRFVRRWERLQRFIREYDARGPVDLTVRLRKRPGRDQPVEFVEATLEPKGASGQYHHFPYRVHELSGSVRLLEDGSFVLHDLAGTHGDTRVVINADLGGYVSQRAVVEIQGQNVAIDDDLVRCLPERDQALCRTLALAGRVDVTVRLTRGDVPQSEPDLPWHAEIEAAFLDGRVAFERFPYPLEGLAGRLRIIDGSFDIQELRAAHGQAQVVMRGRAERGGEGQAHVDLHLEARHVPLDETLAEALPPEGRALYQKLAPAGTCDLSGRIATADATGDISYDLTARLSDASIGWDEKTPRLSGIDGSLRIDPRRVQLDAVRGRVGESAVSVAGQVGLGSDEPPLSLRIRSDELVLDGTARALLPESLRAVWDGLAPSGRVRIDAQFDKPSAPASEGQRGRSGIDYAVTLEPVGAALTWSPFPLPLHDVNGRVVVRPQGVRIERLEGRCADATLALAGDLTHLDACTAVSLSITARDLALTDALRDALPWRFRRLWDDMKPSGRIDLDLDEVATTLGSDETGQVRLRGAAKLDSVSLSMGTELTGMNGTVRGEAGFGDAFRINAAVALDGARVDGRLLEDARARLVQERDAPLFRVEELSGRFYGGRVQGRAELNHAGRQPRYGLSITGQDISLEAFLNAERPPDKPHTAMKGSVHGSLSLTGRLGQLPSRRGGGEIVIRKAQMMKIPLVLSIMQVVHFSLDDDNAFHDAVFRFNVAGDRLILDEIDLRGSSMSMVGSGRVHVPTQALEIVLLVGSPLRLPRIAVLSDLVEGVARELMEVHVEGTLDQPVVRAEIIKSLKQTLDLILNLRAETPPESP